MPGDEKQVISGFAKDSLTTSHLNESLTTAHLQSQLQQAAQQAQVSPKSSADLSPTSPPKPPSAK